MIPAAGKVTVSRINNVRRLKFRANIVTHTHFLFRIVTAMHGVRQIMLMRVSSNAPGIGLLKA
jgi:hypothetical protein